jgi:hypothetical protein
MFVAHRNAIFKKGLGTVPIIGGIVDSVLVKAQLLRSEAVSLGFLQLLLHLGCVFRYISDTLQIFVGICISALILFFSIADKRNVTI